MNSWAVIAGTCLLAVTLSACQPAPRSKASAQLYHKVAPGSFHSPPSPPAQTRPASPSAPLRSQGAVEISSISMEDLFNAQQAGTVMIFDARPAYFYHIGRIPGAISMPAETCDARIQTLESEINAALKAGKTLVVYCSGLLCKDARTVAKHLANFGYPVSKFYGGWNAWSDANLPIDKTEP